MSNTDVSFDLDFSTPVKARPPSLSPSKSARSVLSSSRGLKSPGQYSVGFKSPGLEEQNFAGKILLQKIRFSHFVGAMIDKMTDVYARVNIVGLDTENRTDSKNNCTFEVEFSSLDLKLNMDSVSTTSTIAVSLWKKFSSSVDILVASGVVELQQAIRKPNETVEVSGSVSDNGKHIAGVALVLQFTPKQPEVAATPVTESPVKIVPRPFSAFGSTLWRLSLQCLEVKELYDTGSKVIKQSPAVTVKISSQSLTTARAVDAGTQAKYSEQLVFYFDKNQFSTMEMEIEVSHLTSRNRKLYEVGRGKMALSKLFPSGHFEPNAILLPLVYTKKNEPSGSFIAKGKLEAVEKKPGTKYEATVIEKDTTKERRQELETRVMFLNTESSQLSNQLNHLTDDVTILRGFQDEMAKLLKEQGALLATLTIKQ